MYTDKQFVNYEINKKTNTSKIILSKDAKDDIFIPASIIFESKEYIVTDIESGSFKYSKIKSLKISDDSNIHSIPKDVFAFSTIQKLHLSINIENLEEGWCHATPELKNITISPHNKNFQIYENNLLIGKDGILYFANRSIEEITIPSIVKQINSYSFENCYLLKKVKFTEDSQLIKINSESFSKSNIEELEIPSKVEKLDENWCHFTPKLNIVKVSPNNQNFVNIGNKIIIGKKNKTENHYDHLYFVARTIETAIIPSTIRCIISSAISKLSKIHKIKIKDFYIFPFLEKIPSKYEKQKNQNNNNIIKKIYSKFIFKYYMFCDQNKENTAFNLFYYLVNFNFIIFATTKIKNDQHKINCIFCVEGECIIIEQIEISAINKIIENLTKFKIALIDISSIPIISGKLQNDSANDEVNSFCSFLIGEIKNNDFVKYTIKPIVGYLIRRYYFPSDYFIDKSFFYFNQGNIMKEKMLKQELNDYFITEIEYETVNKKSNKLMNILNKIKESYKELTEKKEESKQEFEENEFIVLRKIYSKEFVNYYLAIHIQSLYIFMIEKVCSPNAKMKGIYREIELLNNPHRSLTPIYGILLKESKIIGLVYEFMSNGSLNCYLENRKFDEIYMLMIIYRLFNGINHLHSKELIHRDLKPGNILIDHDGLPYISDFETVRPLDFSVDALTVDIGSMQYSSPEQAKGENISYSTDIYSFGQIIRFLLEKHNIPNIESIEELSQKCVQNDPDLRMENYEIDSILQHEIQNFFYFERYLMNEKIKIDSPIIINYIYDNVYNEFPDQVFLCFFNDNIQNFLNLFLIKIMKNESFFLLSMGLFYEFIEYNHPNYLKAIEYYEKSSLLKNSEALNKLGYFYEKGIGVERDYQKAKEFYEKSSFFNNTEALNNLGRLYEYGIGTEQNYKKAKEFYKKSVQYNNSNALINLGLLYFFGNGVEQNYHKAQKYFEKSSLINNSEAFIFLGDFYFYGYGVKQDYLKAKEYYEKSSFLGNSEALIKVGDLYCNGYGVELNYGKAMEYYLKSSELDNSDALIKIGDIYYYGYGIKQDYQKAYEYYEESSDLKNSNAMIKLGDLYYKGLGTFQDYENAIDFYEKSSIYGNIEALKKLGEIKEYKFGQDEYIFNVELNYINFFKNPSSLYNLGIIYENGYGVKQNSLKAKQYYEKSLLLNNFIAFNKLGDLYYFGNGVKQDYRLAKEYYKKSSQFNDTKSLNKLGDIYFNGYGVEKDYLRAIEFYEKSSKLNDANALNKLGDIYYNGYGIKQDFIKAKIQYEKSMMLNNSEAMFKLGDLYFHGKGVKQDYLKAKEFYEKSSKFNNSDAINKLGDLYYYGNGVNQNYLIAKKYYEESARLNNVIAIFHLGNLYSDGDIFDIDLQKAIEFFMKSIKIKSGLKKVYNPIDKSISEYFESNNYRYISYNNVGLIQMTDLKNVQKAEKFIKEAAFAEYPFGQNNFGLLNQFYINKLADAEYMYERSSKHNFSLAEYNLGFIREKENKISESIQYYIKASEHENEPLIFRNINHYDKRLEISKKFIICIVDLKLIEYFFNTNDYINSKKYFVKLINGLKTMKPNSIYSFEFKVNIETQIQYPNDVFSYIKEYILNYPAFNLINHPDIKLNELLDNSDKKHFQVIINTNELKSENEIKNQTNSCKKNPLEDFSIDSSNNNEKNEKIFNDPNELFEFIIKNLKTNLPIIFINEIREIIKIMNNILYTPPYRILFGRISLIKPKINNQNKQKDIDNSFYQGFKNVFYDCGVVKKPKPEFFKNVFYDCGNMQDPFYFFKPKHENLGLKNFVTCGMKYVEQEFEEEEQEFEEEKQEFEEEEQEFEEEEQEFEEEEQEFEKNEVN